MEKKKIVILSAFYEPYMSGAEQMVKEVAERIGNRYDTTLITGRYSRENARFENRSGFKLVRVGIGHAQIDKLLYPLLAAIKVRRIKPVITHAIMESYAGGALVLLKYLYPKTIRILTLQSGNLEDNVMQSKLLVKWFYRIIHLAPHRITAISSYLARRMERLNINKGEVMITPNGIDFSEIPKGVQVIENRVVFLGRLSYEKGLDYLLKAWPAVIKSVPGAKLALVGPDGDVADKLRELAKELKITDSVTFTGGMPHDQALKEIKKSEVFICPSSAEGLGNVFFEAQACGVTPIGTNVGGIPDIITHGENGLLIEPSNSDAISRAIIRLLGDRELNQRLRRRGLETSRKFNWQDIVEKIDALYKEIIKKIDP